MRPSRNKIPSPCSQALRAYKEERRVCCINAPADEITPNGTLVIEKIGRPAH
jgi:hypothetical protein